MNLLVGRNQPPWDDDWQLDSKIFTQMEAWDTAHPESTLTKVLEKVNDAVTLCQLYEPIRAAEGKPDLERDFALGMASPEYVL